MIGFIITGHGNFASGLYSACKMLIGDCEGIEVVDFIEGTDIESLDAQFEKAIKNLETCEHIVVFSDLFGGSPFNRVMMQIVDNLEKYTIFGGINLPTLLEALLMTSQNIKLPSSIGGGENFNIQTNEEIKSLSQVLNNNIKDDDLKSQQGLDKEGYKEFLKQIFADSFVDSIDRLQG